MAAGRSQHGFTLIEALVALALTGLLMVGAFGAYASSNGLFNRGLSRAEAHQNARVALDQLSRELRMAGYDLSNVIDGLPSPTPIQTAKVDEVRFVADLDRDGTLERVTYREVNGTLVREHSVWDGSAFPTPTSSEVATGLSAPVFTYLDDAQPTNAVLTAPVTGSDLDEIRRVTIELTSSATTVGEQQSFPLFVDVELRN